MWKRSAPIMSSSPPVRCRPRPVSRRRCRSREPARHRNGSGSFGGSGDGPAGSSRQACRGVRQAVAESHRHGLEAGEDGHQFTIVTLTPWSARNSCGWRPIFRPARPLPSSASASLQKAGWRPGTAMPSPSGPILMVRSKGSRPMTSSSPPLTSPTTCSHWTSPPAGSLATEIVDGSAPRQAPYAFHEGRKVALGL